MLAQEDRIFAMGAPERIDKQAGVAILLQRDQATVRRLIRLAEAKAR